jgi:hypothetical protein
MRRYKQRLTAWSEPRGVKVYRGGTLLGSLSAPDRVDLARSERHSICVRRIGNAMGGPGIKARGANSA